MESNISFKFGDNEYSEIGMLSDEELQELFMLVGDEMISRREDEMGDSE